MEQRIIEAKTGMRRDFAKVEAIPDAWVALPRKRLPCRLYTKTVKSTLQRFVDFMRTNHREADDMAAVRADHVRAFLKREEERGISPRTWNITLKLLKAVFRKLEPNAGAYRGFLRDAAFRDEDTIHREPFNEGEIHAEEGDGKRLKRGSVRGWHSFRVAFVTRALAGGMPEELVRRVTGHTAVDIVRRHYFKPGREEFRREFEKAMPRMLMNGAKSRDAQLWEIIEHMTTRTLKQDKARLLELLQKGS